MFSDDFEHACSTNNVPIIITSIGVLQFISLFGLFVYIKRNQRLVANGDKKASMILVMPIYDLIFKYTLLAGTLAAVDNMLNILYGDVYLFSAKYFLYRLAAECTAFFLMHNGVGEKALKRSLSLSFLWSSTTTSIQIILYFKFGPAEFYFTAALLTAMLLIFYSSLWLSPLSFLHRRPAAINYAQFYVAVDSVTFITLLLVLFQITDSCAFQLTIAILDYFQPFLVLKALVSDSKFWQGINL
jgi:hypothetical protein